jgi:hypothetical protein
MPTPKKKRSKAKKKKGRIVVSQKAKIVKKGTQTAKKDTLQRMDAQMPRTNGAVLKVKIKRK